MRNISNIVIHCTAGYGNVESIKKYWKDVLKWKSFGYHIIIGENGDINHIAPLSSIVNGVKGYNSKSVHISYIGGIDKHNYRKSLDTRTSAQEIVIISAIKWVLLELKKTQDISKIEIKGHRDFSTDKNKNGVVDSWERIKECPSFDAIPEYQWLIKHVNENIV